MHNILWGKFLLLAALAELAIPQNSQKLPLTEKRDLCGDGTCQRRFNDSNVCGTRHKATKGTSPDLAPRNTNRRTRNRLAPHKSVRHTQLTRPSGSNLAKQRPRRLGHVRPQQSACGDEAVPDLGEARRPNCRARSSVNCESEQNCPNAKLLHDRGLGGRRFAR